MIAIIFPGQGSQSIGMAKDFYENFPNVKKIFENIQKSTGIDVKNIIFEDKNNQLDITEFTQLCIFCTSISIYSTIKEIYGTKLLDKISFMAGHSLGEYSALTAAEAINIEDCSKLLKFRGQYMQNSDPNSISGMLAVIGLNVKEIELILNKKDFQIEFEIANDNSPDQVVISSKKIFFDEISIMLKSCGAKKIIPLKVSAAFHSSFMDSAEKKMANLLKNTYFNNSKYPIISNFNAYPCSKSSDIVFNLEKQITNRVRWVETIKFLEKNNISHLIEIGPGKVLNGLNKRISKNFVFINVTNADELEKIKNVI